MKHLLAAAFVCAAAAPALAQAPSIAGAWGFETEPHRTTGCVIRGEAVLRPKPREADKFEVTLNAAERCPDGGVWRAEESCTAERRERTLRVACTLVRALPYNYNADQFSLTIESNASMNGRLFDHGVWNAPVRWRRTAAPIA